MRNKRRRPPKLRVHVVVYLDDDTTVVEYSFNYNDTTARRAFADRCHDAWRAGQLVLTYMEE